VNYTTTKKKRERDPLPFFGKAKNNQNGSFKDAHKKRGKGKKTKKKEIKRKKPL
jgi:hypothetical protein